MLLYSVSLSIPQIFSINKFGGMQEQTNTEQIILSEEDISNLESEISGISDATITYTTKEEAEGGDLEESVSYTIACVKENYADISNLSMAIGEFLTEDNDTYKERTCVLGYSVAKEMFDSVLNVAKSAERIVHIIDGCLE